MLVSTSGIVLSKIKYGDSDLIVKCYTKEHGVVGFLLRNILKTKKGKLNKAYFLELSQLHLQILLKPNRSLQIIKEAKLEHQYIDLHSNVLKSAIVLFLSEILNNVLKEEEKNELLYDYLEATLLWLDVHQNFANFHLLFLTKLTKHLGFYPDETDIEFDYFNLEEGKFQSQIQGVHVISGENLTLLKQLLGTTFDALHVIKINANQRQSFLNMMLLYFKLHLGNFRSPKSLTVLNQVFN